MNKFLKRGALALGLACSVYLVTACPALQQLGGEIKGNIVGKVTDPATGTGVSGAKIYVFANKEITDPKVIDSSGKLDLDELAKLRTDPTTTTDANGAYKVADLKVADGPYVIVASNARGKDFRGVDRVSKKLFDVKFDGKNFPEVDVEKVVFPNPTKDTTLDFDLPKEEPPAPKAEEAAPTPEPIPTPAPTPTPAATPTPGSAADVQNKSELAKPNPTPAAAAKSFGALAVAKADGTALTATETAADGFQLYKVSDSDLTGGKLLLTAKATGLNGGSATLLVSHYVEDKGKAAVTEQSVSFGSDGTLITAGGSSKGYTIVIPRDGGKTIFQLIDRSGGSSGAVSNAVALDASGLDKTRTFTVMMSWDKGGGHDIDLHTYDADKKQEAWFGNFTIDNGSLDLDNIDGYGPETYTGKAAKYGVSVNYWYGPSPRGTNVKVRVIYLDSAGGLQDKTFLKKLNRVGEWWDVGVFEAK